MIDSILIFLNLGAGEVFLVVLVIVMLFGSDKLPELVKGLGKGIREINDAKNQIQNEIQKSTSGVREEFEKHTTEILKSTGSIKEEFVKHTTEIQTDIEKAGQSVKRQMGGAIEEPIKEEPKVVSDIAKG
jgi:sec-independent protein translocase protein TatA